MEHGRVKEEYDSLEKEGRERRRREGPRTRRFRARCSGSGKWLTIRKVDMNDESGALSVERDIYERMVREDAALFRCKSPHVVKRLSSFVVGTELCAVMDEVDAISTLCLREASPLTENQISSIIAQALLGLNYLHNDADLVHCAIRAENIVVALDTTPKRRRRDPEDYGTRCVVKLDGFHSSVRRTTRRMRHGFVGLQHSVTSVGKGRRRRGNGATNAGEVIVETDLDCNHWMPPEIVDALNVHDDVESESTRKNRKKTPRFALDAISPKVDIWSLGITAIELMLGRPPYAERTPTAALRLLRTHGLPPSLLSRKISPAFMDFVSCCLKENPSNRPNANELIRHPFVASSIGSIAASSLTAVWQGVRHNEMSRENNRVVRLNALNIYDLADGDFARVVRDLRVRTSHMNAFDEDIQFVDVNGATLVRSSSSRSNEKRTETRAVLRASLIAMLRVDRKSEGDDSNRTKDAHAASSIDTLRGADRTSSDDIHDDNGDNVTSNTPFFFPLASAAKTMFSDENDENVDVDLDSAAKRVMNQAVQRCLAIHACGEESRNASRVTTALAQLQSAIAAVDAALPNGTLSFNFLSTCVHNLRHSKESSMVDMYESPSIRAPTREPSGVLTESKDENTKTLRRFLRRRWEERSGE